MTNTIDDKQKILAESEKLRKEHPDWDDLQIYDIAKEHVEREFVKQQHNDDSRIQKDIEKMDAENGSIPFTMEEQRNKIILGMTRKYSKRPSTIMKTIQEFYDINSDKPNDVKRWNEAIDDADRYFISQIKEKQVESPEEKKITVEITDEMIEQLKDPNLLLNIIEETQKDGVVGEEDNIISTELYHNMRLLLNAKPTSSNHGITGRPGYGKDNYADRLIGVTVATEDLVEIDGASPKTFDYWMENPAYKGWTWDKKLLKFTDPPEETINSDSFKALASGKKEVHTIIDQKHVVLKVPGKPAITITSYKSTLDPEGERRWELLQVDESIEVDKEVVITALKRRNSKYKNNGTEQKNDNLRNALKYGLKRYSVDIPFTDEIQKEFPDTMGDVRTKIDTFCDLIASSTVLHQYQRERNENGELIAEPFDYDVAVFVFNLSKGKRGKSLGSKERTLVDYLSEEDEAQTIKEIEMGAHIGRDWLYNNQDKLIEKQILTTETKLVPCGALERPTTAFRLVESNYKQLKYSPNIIAGLSPDNRLIVENEIKRDNTDYGEKNNLERIIEKINDNRTQFGLKNIEISYNSLKMKKMPKSRLSKCRPKLQSDDNQGIITSVPQSNFEPPQHKEERLLKSVASDKIKYDFCCDTEHLQLAIDIVQEHYDVLTDTTITDMIKEQVFSDNVSEKELVSFVGEIYELVIDANGV